MSHRCEKSQERIALKSSMALLVATNRTGDPHDCLGRGERNDVVGSLMDLLHEGGFNRWYCSHLCDKTDACSELEQE